MTLPFSHDDFLNVFGAYNSRLWPALLGLWLITAGAALWWFLAGRLNARALFGLLAVHWAWSAIAYHWFFFRRINQAAALFAVLFLVQATLFAWLTVSSHGYATTNCGRRSVIGAALVIYGLAYPFLGFGFGLQYPRLPLFAVPCPTTLITAGWLVASIGTPRLASIIPILWAAVGSSAAFALGIRADLALIVAGLALALDALAPATHGRRGA